MKLKKSQPTINKDKVIIEDWNSDDEKMEMCLKTGLVNPVRPNRKRTVHTARPISTDRPVSTARPFSLKIAQTSSAINLLPKKYTNGNPEICLQDHAVVDSGFSSHMTGNKAYLSDYEDYNGGFVAFGSDPKGGKITAPRRNDVYSLDLKNIVPSGGLENQLNHKVKIIRSDHGTKFKNHAMNELCVKKGIKREFSMARTPQQNGVSRFTFTYPILGIGSKPPSISFMRPFGCPLTILNTLDPLGKFDGKLDEGYLLGYSTSIGNGPDWMFDLDFLTNTMNYIPVSIENQEYILLPLHPHGPRISAEDVAEKEEQHNLTEAEQALKDDLEKLVTQEMVAKAIDDTKRQAFEEEKQQIASTKRAARATSINKLNTEEPKTISQALEDESWVEAIGKKWVFKNKRDKRSIVVKNKARLVAQGFRQEGGIDYDEIFALVARIEAIRLFLAFASFMRFPVYQMDVKSAFLYGTIGEEVYVHQHPGFVDPAHPHKVYKVVKARYGRHQAPKAWYETLSTFLLENGFKRGYIDKDSKVVTEFEDCMHKRFQTSSMGELTFFLGLQVKQQPNEIFISQDKYVADILKKFDFWSIRTATTLIESNKPLVKDEDGIDVDVHVHVYRSIIGSLMYLTASRPDIMFAVCACAKNIKSIQKLPH
ncbi:retrovirus-related pol polyprotein from transposon TNT 1-94 [Tanacetum coccineum]